VSAPASPLRCAADLQEAVVLRELDRRARANDRAAADAYRTAADRIYARCEDAESRRAAFQALHARIFDEMACGRSIVEALDRLGLRFEAVYVTRAWSPTDEAASLGSDRKTLGIRLMVDRFGAPHFHRFLEHELGHVIDMLDPAFGYGVAQVAGLPAARRQTEERFSLLWDCVVDGRTARAGGAPLGSKQERCAAFARLFPELPPDAGPVVIGLLWNGARPTYAALTAFVRDPQALALWGGLLPAVGVASAPAHAPGAPCPLCGFPTFSWETAIPQAIAGRIAGDFPAWSPALGACQRCVEGYAVTAELGATA
jgi:hypothetical protein